MKTIIGILSFNDLHYLKKVLPTIHKLPDSRIIILDNAHNDEVKNFIEKEYPEIKYLRHKDGNIGFGNGHNYILEHATVGEYYFCLNNDILINEKGFEECIDYLDKHKETAMISGKLYHWDFAKNKKTNIIDTVGIVGNRAHSFWDRGQGKKDKGQYDRTINNIFGISGAAFIIRREAIEKIQRGSESEIRRRAASECALFDPNIFMYKEDIDLSYRLRWIGAEIVMLNTVLGWHARTLAKGSKKTQFLAKMSYKNHLIMLRNNLSSGYSLHTRFLTFIYEKAKFLFYIVTKPKVALELFRVLKVKNIHKSKRTVEPKTVEKFLLK